MIACGKMGRNSRYRSLEFVIKRALAWSSLNARLFFFFTVLGDIEMMAGEARNSRNILLFNGKIFANFRHS